MKLNKNEINIKVTLEDILDSGHWEEYCDKYGKNEWCLNEGLANNETEETITLEDAEQWGLINNDNN